MPAKFTLPGLLLGAWVVACTSSPSAPDVAAMAGTPSSGTGAESTESGTGMGGTPSVGAAGSGGTSEGSPTGVELGLGGALNDAGAPTVNPGATCPVFPSGEKVVSISGTWGFSPNDGAPTSIEVPGGGWLAQGFGATTRARYERSITIPTLGEPQATRIEFGVVNHRATLSVDGTIVSTSTTSFTPAVFDVTAFTIPGMTQALSVEVIGRRDPTLRRQDGNIDRVLVPDAASWSAHVPQGIFRSASVRALPALHVADAFVRTDVAADQLTLQVEVTNAGSAAVDATVSVELESFNCQIWNYPQIPSVQVSVAAGQTLPVTLGPVSWGLGESSYWWPNVPYQRGYRARLHYATIRVESATGNATPHSLPVRFGFRDTRQVGPSYELNGVKVNFRGDSLQGANYDTIVTAAGGTSDAFDLVPGFLPPTAENAGWPGAVDNYQRLNYNVSRIHQEPASPYMLDVADEMGFMIIDELAIRGTEGVQDFLMGEANMLAHAPALVLRDRNHPSVIRWSQSNESEFNATDSPAFEQRLYQAIMAADDTRPVSADSGFNGPGFDRGFSATTATNFAVFEHYPSGLGQFTQQFQPGTRRPFSIGEFVWPLDNQPRGLTWFATSTLALRLRGVPEIRAYTLLSAWVSFVPGVSTTSVTLEQGFSAGFLQTLLPNEVLSGRPLFGADNLPDPFSNPIITRVQRAFNPVAVVDVEYWDANRSSNAAGDWPSVGAVLARGAEFTRSLLVFNDTFSGTAVEVAWELRSDGPNGPVADMGQQVLDIPLGERRELTISLTAPPTGERVYLVLQSSKAGQQIFRDDAQVFELE